MTDFFNPISRRAFLNSTVVAGAALSQTCIGENALMADEASAKPAQVKQYPFFHASGTHRELGQQHGEQAIDYIQAHIDYMCSSMKVSRQELQQRSLKFVELFNKHCPHLIDEIKGLGEGAKITFGEALATNIRSALNKSPDGGCTTFVVSKSGTADGNILVGQNSDMLPAMVDLAYVLHLKPENKPETLMWTFGGMIGYHGINSEGIGQFANDVGGGPVPRFAMPHYPLKRLMMECRSLDEVEKRLGSYPAWASGNYVLCDGAGKILDVEVTPDGYERITDQNAGFIAHSNHFVSPKYATANNHKLSAADSFTRLDRMNALIKSRYGQLKADDFKTFLRDKQGQPCSICRFATTRDAAADWTCAGITVASIVAEPAKRQMFVAVGNQVETPFVCYKMDA